MAHPRTDKLGVKTHLKKPAPEYQHEETKEPFFKVAEHVKDSRGGEDGASSKKTDSERRTNFFFGSKDTFFR